MLTPSTIFAYTFFRCALSPIDLTLRLNARTTVWQDALGMTAGMQASLVSAVKSFDFLLGFLVGKASDKTRTRWGRRKPWIACMFPFGLVCFVLFSGASYFFGGDGGYVTNGTLGSGRVVYCAGLMDLPGTNSSAPSTASASPTCPELRACLEAHIASGLLEPHNNTGSSTDASSASKVAGGSFGLLFVVLYFGFYFANWTGTQIPYDAWGYELSFDHDERTRLFGWKALSQLVGYLVHPLVGLALASHLADDLVLLTLLRAVIFAGLGLLGYALLLGCLHERVAVPLSSDAGVQLTSMGGGTTAVMGACSHQNGGRGEASAPDGPATRPAAQPPVPIIPSVRRALANPAYRRYLVMKVPLTLFSLIPSNMLSFFIKYVLALEDWAMFESIAFLVALVGGVVAIPATVKLARCIGKGRALAATCALEGVLYVIFFALPPRLYRQAPALTLVVLFFAGVGISLPFTLPDALLADIIDYDELRTAQRNEGIYTVVETSLQQWVEIAGGVIPLMVLGGAGYEPLGGCTCGCGIACDEPYLRWRCPNDVGYTCGGGLGEALLFGEEPDVAPCAHQPPAVLWSIHAFLVGIPGVLALAAAMAATRQLIDAHAHGKIRGLLDGRASTAADALMQQVSADGGRASQPPAGGTAAAAATPLPIDPVTKCELRPLPDTTRAALLHEHFSPHECSMSLHRLRRRLGGRVACWLVIIIGLVTVMAATRDERVVTIGCLILSVLFVLTPWDGYRLYVARKQGAQMWGASVKRAGGANDEAAGSADFDADTAPLTPRKAPRRGLEPMTTHEMCAARL